MSWIISGLIWLQLLSIWPAATDKTSTNLFVQDCFKILIVPFIAGAPQLQPLRLAALVPCNQAGIPHSVIE